METPSLPLTPAEMKEFEAILDSDIFDGEAMLPDELQGMFFALASAPELVPPSVWMPEALGDEQKFADEAQAQRLLALLMRFYNQSIEAAAGDEFELILYEDDTGEPDYGSWCSGFLSGVDLSEVDWYEAGDPDDIGDLLFPLLVLADAMPEEEKRRIKPTDWRRLVRESRESLPDTLAQIYRYWRVTRTPPVTVRREAPKVGRNDPCPCGSGRKFKQCCGAGGILH
jgi:uncharacterized protein